MQLVPRFTDCGYKFCGHSHTFSHFLSNGFTPEKWKCNKTIQRKQERPCNKQRAFLSSGMSSARDLISYVVCCGTTCQKKETILTSRPFKMSNSKVEKIKVVENEEEVVETLIRYIVDKSKAAIAERNRFVIGLSGKNLMSHLIYLRYGVPSYLSRVLNICSSQLLSVIENFFLLHHHKGGSACTFFCRGLPKVASECDWSKWKFIFCDERVVPFDNPDCTFDVYRRELYSKLPLTDDHFVAINPNLSGTIFQKFSKFQKKNIFINVYISQLKKLQLIMKTS